MAEYDSEFNIYSEYSDNDVFNQMLKGMVNFNFKGGLSLSLKDQYENSSQPIETGVSSESDEYESNEIDFIVSDTFFEKMELEIEVSKHEIDYDEDRNDFKNYE